MTFRGSIPHPMQSLLYASQPLSPAATQHSLADATPYSGRTCTGWIAKPEAGALIQSPRRRVIARSGHFEAECPDSLCVDHKFELGRLQDQQVGRLLLPNRQTLPDNETARTAVKPGKTIIVARSKPSSRLK